MLLLLSALLYVMQRKHVSFSKRVFMGLGLGIAYGLILQFAYGTESAVLSDTVPWFNIDWCWLCQTTSNDCYATCIYFNS